MSDNKFTLSNNQVVVLRNGKNGVVSSFNGMPFLLVFDSFTSQIGKYNDELKHKNNQYDIVKVFDGSSITDVKSVYRKSFNTDGLELLWEEK